MGKIGIPDSVLLKPGRLDDDELETMRGHTLIGAEILAASPSPLIRLAEEIAMTHHERWDGTGYPLGLAGEDIPLSGRIAAICDVFDALLATRPYKRAWALEETATELRHLAGRLRSAPRAPLPRAGARTGASARAGAGAYAGRLHPLTRAWWWRGRDG